jgi:hypothetical protein
VSSKENDVILGFEIIRDEKQEFILGRFIELRPGNGGNDLVASVIPCVSVLHQAGKR